MEATKILFNEYQRSKESLPSETSFDMIKRIFDYRKNIDSYNSYGLKKNNNRNES